MIFRFQEVLMFMKRTGNKVESGKPGNRASVLCED